MRRIKKKIFLGFNAGLLIALGGVRQCNPHVAELMARPSVSTDTPADSLAKDRQKFTESPKDAKPQSKATYADVWDEFAAMEKPRYHRIQSVRSYKTTFPDLQDTQIVAAKQWGVGPVPNREAAEARKDELVYIGSSPYYSIDKRMNASIPYLVPRASQLLQEISRNFLDSLAVKGIPLHKIIVSSVLRTEVDVTKLKQKNPNATEQSCHLFGTTFDISYTTFETVCPPGEQRRAVRDDTLKYVLSEVLRDLREQERCFIKHEVKQPCFHITTR